MSGGEPGVLHDAADSDGDDGSLSAPQDAPVRIASAVSVLGLTPRRAGDAGSGALSAAEVKRQRERYETRLRMIEAARGRALEALHAHPDPDANSFTDLVSEVEVYANSMSDNAFDDSQLRSPQRGASRTKHRRQADEHAQDESLLREEIAEEEFPPFTRLHSHPWYIHKGEMRDYQVYGLNWLVRLFESGLNGILADDMGLGKSIQTVSLLGYLRYHLGIKGPHLVVAPNSTLGNWINEFNMWCPEFKAVRFQGDKAARDAVANDFIIPGKADVIVTSYEVAIIEKAVLKKVQFEYLVIDEAHRIKNENSVLSKVVRLYNSKRRLLVTGTPLQNNLHELWALLNFVLPSIFDRSEVFDERFNSLGNRSDDERQAVVQQLHAVLRPFILRRLKKEIKHKLPPKKETKLYVGMSEMQTDWYKRVLMKDVDAINSQRGTDRLRLLNIVMQLRKVCNHPYLFEGAEPTPFEEGEHLVRNSAKLDLLDKLLARLKRDGHRVLIFSQMTRMLDILEDYLMYRQFDYCRFDGSTPSQDRDQAIAEFNKDGSTKFCFLLSTRAGGLGINLATADTVVLFDSDWNPQVDLQAQDRAHRIGQKRPVNVYRFITEKTIEEKIIERAERKLLLDALVIQSGRLVDQQKAMSSDDLAAMIQYGAQEVIHASHTAYTEADLDDILKRGEARTQELQERLTEQLRKVSELLGGNMDELNTYNFEGENYRGVSLSNPLGFFLEPPKRERKNTINVDQYFREALNAPRRTGVQRAKFVKPPRQPPVYVHQFYPDELRRINAKEMLFYERQVYEAQLPAEGDADAAPPAAVSDEVRSAEPLTQAELDRKDALYRQGFGSWSRKDFRTFLYACGQFGRTDYEAIAKYIETKTPKEVEEYSRVFWQRYSEIPDSDRLVKLIEAGEARLQKHHNTQSLVDWKLEWHQREGTPVNIPYRSGSSKSVKEGVSYTEEQDVALLKLTKKHGFGEWDVIVPELQADLRFAFDMYLLTRNKGEVAQRASKLVRLIELERTKVLERERAIEEHERNRVLARQAFAASASTASSASAPASGTSPARPKAVKTKQALLPFLTTDGKAPKAPAFAAAAANAKPKQPRKPAGTAGAAKGAAKAKPTKSASAGASSASAGASSASAGASSAAPAASAGTKRPAEEPEAPAKQVHVVTVD